MLLLISTSYLTKCCFAAKFSDMRELYNNLTGDHNRYLRPTDDQSLATTIATSFHIVTLQEINEVKGTVSITGYFDLKWKDVSLQWNPYTYGNITSIVLPLDLVWTPPILAANSGEKINYIRMKGSSVRIEHTGTVIWTPGSRFVFTCSINSVNFPFDQHECMLEIVAWGYSNSEIVFNSTFGEVMTSFYSSNSEWELTKTKALNRYLQLDDGVPEIVFILHFKRRPVFYVFNLILPASLMALLNTLVFILPQESGERISFSITLLLSGIVFLTITQNLLPAIALPSLANVCVFLIGNMIMSGFVIFSVIISAWLYYKKEQCIPVWVEKFELFMRFPSYNHQTSVPVTWKRIATLWDTISFCFYSIFCIVWNIQCITSLYQT